MSLPDGYTMVPLQGLWKQGDPSGPYGIDSGGTPYLIGGGGSGASAPQVQGNVAAAAADSGNPVKVGGKYNLVLPTFTDGQRADLQLNAKGLVMAVPTSGNGTAFASQGTNADAQGTSGTALVAAADNMVFNGATWDRARGDTTGAYAVLKGATSGGLTPTRVVTGTTGVIKAAAGQLYGLTSVQNLNAAVRYLHLYDKATAPTLSTDTPVLTIALAASSVQNAIPFGDIGVAFALGIAWAYTTDAVAIPTTAGTSTELKFSGAYK
jgi:hypothetical protein